MAILVLVDSDLDAFLQLQCVVPQYGQGATEPVVLVARGEVRRFEQELGHFVAELLCALEALGRSDLLRCHPSPSVR